MSDGHGSAYVRAGVDYDVLDAAKRRSLEAAASTTEFAASRGAYLDPRSFGEPASVTRVGDRYLATVLECLGTKSVLARQYEDETGIDRFDAIGYDTVAAIVNDCICVGALPMVVHAYVATGAASFYEGSRHASLVAGFLRGCRDAGAAWGGGESPTLAGLVEPNGVDLAGSTVGMVPHGHVPLFGDALAPGDEIVLVASSGLHQNGASLGRLVAAGLPGGLRTTISDGRELGDALLDPGLIYVALVERLLADGVELHYCSHLTGHGLRKVMRANRELSYLIEELPPVPPVLSFLAEASGSSHRDAYGTLNMGAGFACFVAAGEGDRVVAAAVATGHRAVVAGRVGEGPRQVVVGPVGVTFTGESLDLR